MEICNPYVLTSFIAARVPSDVSRAPITNKVTHATASSVRR